MNRTFKLVAFVFALVILGIIIVAPTQKSNQGDPAIMDHECYVWQRVWDDELRTSLLEAVGQMQAYTVLAAEIDVRPGRLQRQTMPVDYAFLSSLQAPAGLAIRVNPYSGPFDQDSEATTYLAKTIQGVLASATANHFTPSEIQIDFDCAESKLAGYCAWMQQLKVAFPEYPITLTVLPSWLKHRQFKQLVRQCDGFVLQVHSLEKPTSYDENVVLCDPKRALAWIRQAERFNVPFRVALPTYGYRVAYSEQGQFIGLSAEGPLPDWPDKTRIKTAISDPKKMAALIQEIRSVSPKHLTGVIWFRLPVPSDQLNWQWHTLRCVIQDQTLTESIDAVCEWPETNLAEIYLVNSGDVDVSGRISVSLAFDGSCLVGDGLKGYAVIEDKDGSLWIRPENIGAGWRIRSQEKIKIAWCRFNQQTKVNSYVQVERQ